MIDFVVRVTGHFDRMVGVYRCRINSSGIEHLEIEV